MFPGRTALPCVFCEVEGKGICVSMLVLFLWSTLTQYASTEPSVCCPVLHNVSLSLMIPGCSDRSVCINAAIGFSR